MDGDFIDGDMVGDVTSVGCNFLTELLDLMGIFCYANNWGDQVVKTFSTGSPNSRNWKGRVMCPIHTYATAFNGKYGG